MKDIRKGDIVLVNGKSYGIVNDIDYHTQHKRPPYNDPEYWISFDGGEASAWFSDPFIELHIPKGDRPIEEMKELVNVINKLR
jgi:hypothetical protein